MANFNPQTENIQSTTCLSDISLYGCSFATVKISHVVAPNAHTSDFYHKNIQMTSNELEEQSVHECGSSVIHTKLMPKSDIFTR